METTPLTGIERLERPWGWHETIATADGSKVKRIRVQPGQQISLQRHRWRSEHWVVTLGVATVTLGDACFDLAPGQSCDIAVGQVHRLTNRTSEPVEIIEVQFGTVLAEDDVERLQDDYGRR
jgi:mannose-6-phosphate isomerase-like protein (cupin superfamily)